MKFYWIRYHWANSIPRNQWPDYKLFLNFIFHSFDIVGIMKFELLTVCTQFIWKYTIQHTIPTTHINGNAKQPKSVNKFLFLLNVLIVWYIMSNGYLKSHTFMVFRCTFTSPIFFSFSFCEFCEFFVCLLFSFTSSVFLFFAYYTLIRLKRFSEMIETLLFRLLLYISSLYWYSRFSFNALYKIQFSVICILYSYLNCFRHWSWTWIHISIFEMLFMYLLIWQFRVVIDFFYARDFDCALRSIQCFIFIWLGSSSDPVSIIFNFQRTISLIFVIIVQWYQMLSFFSNFNVNFMFLTPRCSVFIISILLIIIKQYTVDEKTKIKTKWAKRDHPIRT